MRLEEGLIEWIRVLREDLEDFKVRVVAKEMNSCGEELRDEQSFLSIVNFCWKLRMWFSVLLVHFQNLWFMDVRGKSSVLKFLFLIIFLIIYFFPWFNLYVYIDFESKKKSPWLYVHYIVGVKSFYMMYWHIICIIQYVFELFINKLVVDIIFVYFKWS